VFGLEVLARKDITPDVAQTLVRLTRESMAATIEQRPIDIDSIHCTDRVRLAENGVHVILLRQGKVLGEAEAQQATLIGNIRVAAARAVALTDAKEVRSLTVVLTVLLQDEVFPQPPMTTLLQRAAGLGLHGLRGEFRGLQRFTPPLRPLLRGWDWHDTLLDLAQRLSPSPPDVDPAHAAERTRLLQSVLFAPDFRLTLVEGVAIASLPEETVPTVLYRFGRLVPLTAVTAEHLQQALQLAEGWYRKNQKENGLFPYLYDPLRDQESDKRHVLREAMNAAAIGSLWRHTKNPETRALGLRALQGLFAEAYLEDPKTGYGYLRLGDDMPTLGAAAAGLYAIAQLYAHTQEPSLQARAERLRQFLLALRREDGRYELSWPPGGELEDQDDHPGEAQLALLAWSQAIKDESLTEPCLQSMRTYRELFRQQVLSAKHPPYLFIPPHTQANLKLYIATRRQEVADFIFEMNHLLLGIQQILPPPGQLLAQDCQGRFLRPQKNRNGETHAAATAMYLESLADTFALARALGETKLLPQVQRALLWGARDLLQLQIRDEFDLLLLPNPDRARGGFRTSADCPLIRIDNMQHAVSALAKILAVFTKEDFAAAQTDGSTR